jgi:hypothetical protein
MFFRKEVVDLKQKMHKKVRVPCLNVDVAAAQQSELAVTSKTGQEINEGHKASGLGCHTHWPRCPSIVGSIQGHFHFTNSNKKDEGALIL